MPQPLSGVVKGIVNVTAGLPLNKPELCAKAFQVIAVWSQIERDTGSMITGFALGKAQPIAELLNASQADSPKRAIRDALARTLLPNQELAIFKELMRNHESCFSLRNPLAHWTLHSCAELPDAIVAIDPRDYLKINSEAEKMRDQMLRDVADPARRHIVPENRIKIDDELKAIMQKHKDAMVCYRDGDLTGIVNELSTLLTRIQMFTVAIRMRLLGVDTPRYWRVLIGLSPISKTAKRRPSNDTGTTQSGSGAECRHLEYWHFFCYYYPYTDE